MDNTKKYHKAGWQTGNPRLYATNSQRAKQMRKEPTEAEQVFWNAVKGGKLGTKVSLSPFRERDVGIAMAMLGASAWREKNVCADDGGTSIAPLVGSQINQPCEQDSQSDLSCSQQLLTELTSSTQTKKLLPIGRTKLRQSP